MKKLRSALFALTILLLAAAGEPHQGPACTES
jgi:hypothetical protein